MKTLHTIYTNFAKRNLATLRLLFITFLTFTVSTNVWGADALWNFESTDNDLSNLSKAPIAVLYAKNNGTNPVAISSGAFRLYKGSNASTNGCSVTFTIDNGYKIESITVVFKDGRTSARGKIDNGSYEDVFSAGNSKTVTISSLSAQSYSIQNQGTNTVAISSITITYSSDTSTPADLYVVTLMDDTDNPLSQTSAGGTVTLPKRDGCTGYTFAGWTQTWTEEQEEWTTTAPDIIEAGTYTPKTNEFLYPVYTKTESGGSGFKLSVTIDDIVYYIGTSISSYLSAVKDIEDAATFNIEGNQYLYYGNKTYVSSNANTTSLTIGTQTPSVTWSISESNGTITFKSNGTGKRYLAFNYNSGSPRFSSYTNNASYPHTLTKHNTSTTSYISVPNCCTKLAEVTNLVFSGITSNSITVGVPNDYSGKANTNGYIFNCYSASTGGSLVATADENGTSHTFTGLTKNTPYYFTVIAKGEGNYCNSAETSPRELSETLAQYTVTLNPDGGTGDFKGWDEVDGNYTQTIEEGNSVTLPKLEDQIACTFGGWSDGTTTHSAGTYTPEADVELTAVWNARQLINYRTLCTYNIEYTNLEGTTHSNPVTYTTADLPLEFTAPSTREGYTFKGWDPETLTAETRGDQEVEAQWAANTYSVIFNANGGEGSMEKQPFTYDVEQALSKNLFTRVGYTFAGWNDNASGNSTSYSDQQVVKNLSSAKNGQRTLYAQWTANTNTPYVVKHYKEQLDGAYPMEADDTDNLTGTTATSVTPAVNSYEGFTAPSTQTVSIAADGSTVVTYQYPRNSYNLSWNVNEGDALTGEYTSGNVKYEAAITQPNTPTRTGYTFIGWSPAEIPATMPANNLEFIAQWAAIHTITWMVNGSQAEGDPTTSVVNGQTITTLPTTPDVDCNGKVFVGWTTAEIVGETTTIPDPLYTKLSDFPVVTSNMTFYAVFANGTGDERWVETEIGDIEATDEVVIAMKTSDKTYAMHINDDATATPDAIVVEPSDLTSASGIATALIWFIEKDGNGKLIIHPKKDIEKNLYCNPSTDNNRVRVGKSHDNHELYKTFEIDGNYLKNSVTLHYIGVNFTHNLWYGYADNSKFPNQTLKFYKKTIVYTSYTNYSTSCMAGVCDITNANPIYVTSAVGQKIRATDKLVLTTTDMAIDTEISLSAPNITFYKEGVEITQLTTTAASETFELEIAYQPTISKTTEQPTITLEILGYQFTFNNKITARSLPETFAIVAKVGNVWYALPSQGLNSTTPPAAYPVEVDNMADPKTVTAVPANADWSLRQVYASSGSNDRFTANGENLVFVNNASPAMTLNASSSEEENYLLTDAQYNNYYSTNPGLYEWTPTTTDLKTYQLTNEQRSRTLSVNTATVFGVHAQNKAVEQVRFLPIQNRYIPMAAQVVEWKENSVVVMYNGNPAQTASVSVNGGAVQTTELSGDGVPKDIAVYELAANGLATNPTQSLSITIGSEKVILPIPYIVGGDLDDATLLGGNELTIARRQEIAKVSDLVILKGATLTADGAGGNLYKFRNVTIYGGGSLIIPAGKGFGANTLTMRVGGVENRQYKNLYPQLQLNGTLTNTSGQINLDYLTTNDFYYPLSVPYSVTIADIQYPVDIYGANVASDNTGSFQFKYYNGAERAAGRTGWIVLDERATPTLNPNTGYAIWGIPKKVKVNGGESTRQKFGIHRLPLIKAANDMMTSEKQPHSATINVYNGSKRDSDNGWNYLGNPYLSHYGVTTDDKVMKLGKLVWDEAQGAWLPTDTEQRYVVFTNDCQNYTAELASTTAISAFSAFFIQADQGGAINFTSPNVATPQSLAARRSEEETKEITTGIILSGEKHLDRTGLLIADQFTEAYEFNADLSKFDNQDMNLYTISSSGKLAFMAINEDLAKQTIPLGYSVSTDGMYTIAFDEQRYSRNDIYALYLIDYDRNETTNLLHMDYNFYSENGAHAERFALQVAFAPNTSTDVEYTQVGDVLLSREGNTLRLDNLPSDATVTVYDAVGHLVEQHTASQLLQLTLQKGYYLLHIGNNQNSVVIDTFIP